MSGVDWVPELAAALDELVPLEESSGAGWDDVVARAGSRRTLRLGRVRPRRSLRLAIVIALLFLLLTAVATATYLLLLRGNGGIALGGSCRLLVANPNGPGLRKIAGCAKGNPSRAIFEPAWSPDGRQVAFTRGRYGAPYERSSMSVYVAAADGGGARRLAPCGLCGEQWSGRLGWSSNGRWIAYSRDTGLSGQESLWIAAAAGGRPRRLTDCNTCTDVQPTWSPDGRVLVFQRLRAPRTSSGLYTVRPDGSGLTRIASGEDPQWSPDGRRIAFQRETRTASTIYIVRPDGSGLTRIASGADPEWSPDGRKLVFEKTPGRPGHFRIEIWAMNADGSAKERLYRSGCCSVVGAPPIWSPDGRLIAFSDSAAGGTFVISADGTGLRRLSREFYDGLSWQRVPRH